MFLEKKGDRIQLNSNSLVVGFDLGESVSQISYSKMAQEEPETLAIIAGTQQYGIPTVLCKRFEVNQWFFGKEALKYANEGEGTLIDGLLTKARLGEPVLIEEIEYDPVALLALFVKRSFSLIKMASGENEIRAAMLTVDELDGRMAEVMTLVSSDIPVTSDMVFFQSHEESAFYYVMKQPKELWNRDVAIYDLSADGLRTYCMELSRRTIPTVAFMPQQSYPGFLQNDDQFLDIVTEWSRGRIINTVYLIGDAFQEEWWAKSQKYLCQNRRVFQGNNLFSKGAVYAVKERLLPTELSSDYILLGKDKLKANLGMKVIREGIESYFVLLNAGEKWYEASKEFDFILESGNKLSILVTPLNKEEKLIAEIALSGLPMRPKKTTRIRMFIHMKNETTVVFRFKDMGFGEFYKSSGIEWMEEMDLS